MDFGEDERARLSFVEACKLIREAYCSLFPDQLGFVLYFLPCPWRHSLVVQDILLLSLDS